MAGKSLADRLVVMQILSRSRAGLRTGKLQKGTTLIELLVVIVIFLIGILAVIQIFPKGFQLLVVTRNNSVAAHLAEDEVERLKQHADQLPAEIVSVHYVGGTPIEDPARDPFDLGPQGDSIDANGNLALNGTTVGNWLLYSGPNSFRRVVAEGSRVPSPRQVGANYGGLMVLNFGPVDPNAPINAYANELVKDLNLPQNLQSVATQSITIGGNSVNVPLFDSTDTLSLSEYFVGTPSASTAFVMLPTNSSFPRTYHLRVGCYFTLSGNSYRQDYTDLLVTVPATTAVDSAGNTPPLIQVPIGTILSNTTGAIPSGATFNAIDYDSLQIAPEFNLVPIANNFTTDPLEYKLLDSALGVLLFNPSGYGVTISPPNGPREPLQARVNYDVWDWRVIRQEFRVDSQLALNGGGYGQFQLALSSLKVGGNTGPDGLQNGVIAPIDTNGKPTLEGAGSAYAATQSNLSDNLMLVDLQTGGVVYEIDPNDSHQVVTINKTTGMVTINSDGAGTGLVGYLAIPGTTGATQVDLTGRALRALYRARNEYSVNVLKAASSYSIDQNGTSTPAEGHVVLSGQSLLFPKSDLHQQVIVDMVNYTDSGGVAHVAEGQSYSVQYATVNTTGYPLIDLTQGLPSGSTVTGVSGIKGSSLTVQVLWNPAYLHLGASGTSNIAAVNTWEHDWRVNRTQTSIPAQELQ